jgi:hypothetical protein
MEVDASSVLEKENDALLGQIERHAEPLLERALVVADLQQRISSVRPKRMGVTTLENMVGALLSSVFLRIV